MRCKDPADVLREDNAGQGREDGLSDVELLLDESTDSTRFPFPFSRRVSPSRSSATSERAGDSREESEQNDEGGDERETEMDRRHLIVHTGKAHQLRQIHISLCRWPGLCRRSGPAQDDTAISGRETHTATPAQAQRNARGPRESTYFGRDPEEFMRRLLECARSYRDIHPVQPMPSVVRASSSSSLRSGRAQLPAKKRVDC